MNQTKVSHLRKDDTVVALSGVNKGKSGKVLEVLQGKGMVKVDGFGTTKRHTKPTQGNPKGGIFEKSRWMPACIFQVCDSSGKKLGRVGFKVKPDGTKERFFSSERKKK